MSDKKVPSMGIKKRMSFDGHTLHTMNIHNPYGSIICIRFEGIISAFPYGKGRHPFVTSVQR